MISKIKESSSILMHDEYKCKRKKKKKQLFWYLYKDKLFYNIFTNC